MSGAEGVERLTLDTAFLAANNDGLEELIVLALLVALLDGLDRVGALLTLTKNHSLESKLVSLPSLIAIHGIVTANDRGDLSGTNLLELGNELLHVCSAGLGVGVTAIAEEVNVDVGDAGILGSLEQGVEVGLLGVLILLSES